MVQRAAGRPLYVDYTTKSAGCHSLFCEFFRFESIAAAGAVAAVVVMVMAAVMALAVVVVGADGVGVVAQPAGQQGLHLGVGAAGGAGVELDAGLGQGVPGPAADAAADQGVHLMRLQEARQGPVAAAVGVHHREETTAPFSAS